MSGAIGSQLDISGCFPLILILLAIWVAAMVFAPALASVGRAIRRWLGRG